MKKIYWGIFLFFSFLLIFALPVQAVYNPEERGDLPAFAPDEFIVKYKEEQTPQELFRKVEIRKERAKSFLGVLQNLTEETTLRISGKEIPEKSLERLSGLERQFRIIRQEPVFEDRPPAPFKNYYLLRASPGIDIQTALERYKQNPVVELAQPNYFYRALDVTPNDSYYADEGMWGLKKIQMEKAWEINKGTGSVIVAVLDTGIDANHEDFVGREIIKGRDYAEGESEPIDRVGHGTHVSGTIGAATNNSLGVAGINWQVKIMAVKVLGDEGEGSTAGITQGVRYAADNGAKVINMSLGPIRPEPDDPLFTDALNYAYNKGVVLVAAAGNSGKDVDLGFQPANHPRVIAVGATTDSDKRIYFSNYGTKVIISAPGVGILSTCIPHDSLPPNESMCQGELYNYANGTSMASPHVAGVAALILAQNPNLTPDQVKNILVTTADPITTDKPIGGRINACKALGGCGSTVTPSPTPGGPTATPTPTTTPGATPTPTPAVTPTPTPTTAPDKGNFEFKIKFQGIDAQSLKTNKKVKVILKRT